VAEYPVVEFPFYSFEVLYQELYNDKRLLEGLFENMMFRCR